MEGRQESGEHGRDCGWGLVEASLGCAHGVSLERRKECVGRRSEGKKCCNGRESVKSMFEEVKGARKGRGGVGGKGGKEEWVTGGCGEGISVGAWKMWKMWDAGSWWEEAAKEFAMVTRTMLDGEQFGWGAVSG